MALTTKYIIIFYDYLGNLQYSNPYTSDPTSGDVVALNAAIAAGTTVSIQTGGTNGPFIIANSNKKISSRAVSTATPS